MVLPPKAAALVALSQLSAFSNAGCRYLLDMRVVVDAARQHQPRLMHRFHGCRAGSAIADRRNDAVPNTDICDELIVTG